MTAEMCLYKPGCITSVMLGDLNVMPLDMN